MHKKRGFYGRGQVSIFVIIAVVVIAFTAGFFFLKDKIGIGGVSSDFKPIEDYYISCLKETAEAGLSLMGQQAGYIYLQDFEPGNEFMPSSNYLNFLGSPVPYWFYISGSNILKEQVPTKKIMQEQLERYVKENLACDFSSFISRGFSVEVGEPEANAIISSNKVDVVLKSKLAVGFGDESALFSEHKASISSNIGKMYDEAVKIYNKEKTETFLEKYALDILYLNAPVNEVELICSPKIWKLEDVKSQLKEAIEENTLMLSGNANYKGKEKYFNVDVPATDNVRFMYSKNWPTKIETQDEDGLMIASPLGNQPGLGAAGFCYVPYHFVYELVYPVLIQIYDDKEIFQFPVSVIVQGNKEREALAGTFFAEPEPDICRYKNNEMMVYTYDSELNPVEADISFKCFNEECNIGKTKIQGRNSFLRDEFPQCVNGAVFAKADGYKTKKETISTNAEGIANLVLDRLYDVSVNLKLGSKETNDMAIVYFESDDYSATLAWPEQKSVELADGYYNISAFVYSNSSIRIPSTKTEKCINTAKPGFFGFFGATEEKCFNIEIPSQELENALVGGGRVESYITETELRKMRADIIIPEFKTPKSLDELQKNYEKLETNKIYVEFK